MREALAMKQSEVITTSVKAKNSSNSKMTIVHSIQIVLILYTILLFRPGMVLLSIAFGFVLRNQLNVEAVCNFLTFALANFAFFVSFSLPDFY
ncbi:hypothetical protein BX070DRAFT_219121 [Coemansia spiralis]|nr:hypothetical protein BX070DRAFT_219121 [Coemansia spiralis]